jgi:hypothetical protein
MPDLWGALGVFDEHSNDIARRRSKEPKRRS